ncbi:hypothetical protein LCGC14_1820470, partial [marine sediment metagenome]
SGSVVKFCTFSSGHYVLIGAWCLKWNDSTPAWEVAKGLLAKTGTGMVGDPGGWLVVATGNDANYWYSTDGSAFTQSNSKAIKLAIVGATYYKSGVAGLDTSIYAASDPTANANWGSAVAIGSTTHEITDLLEHEGNIYIMKENHPYYYDGTTVFAILREMERTEVSTQGKNAISWRSGLYVPAGLQDLWERLDSTNTEVGPGGKCRGFADFSGRVMALASDGHYLYLFADNGSDIEILAGRWETIPGVEVATDFRWHPLAEVTMADIEHAIVESTTGDPRLWFGSTVIKYAYVPEKYGDVVNDSSYRFATGGTHQSCYYRTEFLEATKDFFSFTLLSKGLTANITVTVKYEIDDAGSWTTLGSAFATSPSQKQYFPADTTGKKIRFQYTFTTNDDTKTPEIEGIVVKTRIRFTGLQEWIVGIVCEDEATLKNNVKSTQLGSIIRSQLETWHNTAWPITLYDYDGGSHSITIQGISEGELVSIPSMGGHEESKWTSTITLRLLEAVIA